MSVIRKFRFHFLFAAGTVIAFGVSSWLIMTDSSPFHDYFLWHVAIPNIYSRLHQVAYIAGMILSGNVHQPNAIGFYVAAVLQWFLVGFALSFLFTGFKVRGRDDAT